MERVTPQNLVFLSADDDRQRLHVGSVGRYEGPAPSLDELAARVGAALPLVPRARQRIVEVPLRLSRPVWVDDVDFDLGHHLTRLDLGPDAPVPELHELVGELVAQPFDRERPLWGMWLIDGLADGQWALVTVTHQVMVDGVAGTPLLAVLLDLTPEPRELPSVPWMPRDEPSDLRLVADALSDLAVDPTEVGRVVQSGLRVQGAAMKWAAERLSGRPTVEHHPSGLSGPISNERVWAAADLDLDLVRTVRAARGVTVNDVVLATVTGAFRRLLDHRGVDDDVEHVRIAVPLSVADGHRYENEVTVVSYDLPVGVADPSERLELVVSQSTALEDQGVAADVLRALAGNPSARLLAMGSRMAAMAVRRQRSYHSLVVNVPGPSSDRYLLGRRLLESHPLVPLVDGIRLAIGAVSLRDRIHLGITSDAPHSEDLPVFVDALNEELVLLHG